MFPEKPLPLGNFPTRYSGARCPSLTPQIRTTTATLGNRSHRHSVLSQHSGWRMLPAVFALLYTSTVWTLESLLRLYQSQLPQWPLLCPGLDPPLRKMVKEHSFDKGHTFESG